MSSSSPTPGPPPTLELEVANTTDRVHLLPAHLQPSTWLLDTHYTFLEQRYGGWRAGVPPNNSLYTAEHLTAVYFNNKVR